MLSGRHAAWQHSRAAHTSALTMTGTSWQVWLKDIMLDTVIAVL
jgi:hypothetical protein